MIAQWPTILRFCSSPRTKPFSSRWGVKENSQSNQAAWEDNKVILEGEELVIRIDRGRWFIVKQKQAAGGVFADRPVIAAGAADEILEAPVTTLQGPVAPQPPIVASQPSTLALSVAPQPTLSPTFGPRTGR